MVFCRDSLGKTCPPAPFVIGSVHFVLVRMEVNGRGAPQTFHKLFYRISLVCVSLSHQFTLDGPPVCLRDAMERFSK